MVGALVRELTVPLPLHVRDRGGTRVLATRLASSEPGGAKGMEWWHPARTHGSAHGGLVRPGRPARGHVRLFVPTEEREGDTINGIDARERRKRPSQHSFISLLCGPRYRSLRPRARDRQAARSKTT